jgi:hypothetical protein
MSNATIPPVPDIPRTEAKKNELLNDWNNAIRGLKIAEKIYFWATTHGGSAPPEAWEELRNALGLPEPPPKPLIVRATVVPKLGKRR